MEITELQRWLQETTGIPCETIPQEWVPVLQALAEKQRQSESRIHALLMQKRLFTMLVNGTVDMFMMFSARDHSVDYISPNMEYLLGLSLEEVRADIRVFLNTAIDFRYSDMENLMSVPLGGSVQFLNEHVHQLTGERRWYQKTIYHFYLNNDHKFIMVISDRTTEMVMQRELELSIEMTKSANEAKSSFLANMSHDIRTPMNAIVGLSSLLKHDAENPAKVREHARKITSSSQHLLNLINDILDMSKIESGKATLHMDTFDLSELMEDISIVVQPQAKAKNQTFRIMTHNITCDQVQGDKTRINQILLNLLSNSVKYTPEGGTIQLVVTQLGRADRGSASLQFKVIDNGMGMSPEYLEVIFDAFTREETAAVRGIQGTGLGMAITKNLVELMGGTISVKSEKGIGTEFTVLLKLLAEEKDTDRGFWAEHQIGKILVVDDVETGEDIKAVLSHSGVIVAHTDSAEQASRFIHGSVNVQQPYDLVLVSQTLSGTEGVAFVRELRESLGEQTPPMVLFAYDWSEIEEHALQAGVSAFLQKPFFISGFRSLVQQLRGREAEEEQTSAALSGLHFLVAEDNELNAEILAQLLELEEATCEIAENGQVAADLLGASEAGHYDMILMDVQMPVMDGYTATKTIRGMEHPDAGSIPIVAMTANAFAEDVQNALDAGMDAHVSKPVDMALLKETVGKLLRR